MKGKFKNQNGVGKIEARKLMVSSIKDSYTISNRILTLPAVECQIEKTLFQFVSRKFKYLMCEFDKKLYPKLVINGCKFFPNTPPQFYCGPIGDKIKEAHENEYGHLILDYCGQVGSFKKELEMVFRNDIVEVGGTISMTFNKRISLGASTEFVELMEKLNPCRDEDTRTKNAVITFVNRNGGYKYSIERTLDYHDSCPMILVIVRRIS